MKYSTLMVLLPSVADMFGGTVSAKSPVYIMEDCRLASRQFCQDFEAQSDTEYEGKCADSTHAINGTVFLEARGSDFQCSYDCSAPLEELSIEKTSRGRIWRTGEHVVEVINRTGSTAPFDIDFRIN